MNIIEQATKRLEQMERAGIAVPWATAGVTLRHSVHGDLDEGEISPAGGSNGAANDANVAAAELQRPVVAPLAERSAEAATITIATAVPRPNLEPKSSTELDVDRLRALGYLVPDQVRSQMAEQFRHVKRPILKNARTKGANEAVERGTLIMVTSAVPGEGKTFCSINLAMSMAMEVDTSVILVDADVVRPSLFTRLGIEVNAPGLLDLLTRDELELRDALVSTNIPKLTLMSSGDRSGRSTELLASSAMDSLLARLAADYADHVVIFDAPPLLLTTESAVLASKVGQVVVVVEASKTRRNLVAQAFASLSNCPVVMSVLNKRDEPGDEQRYGYYYS